MGAGGISTGGATDELGVGVVWSAVTDVTIFLETAMVVIPVNFHILFFIPLI